MMVDLISESHLLHEHWGIVEPDEISRHCSLFCVSVCCGFCRFRVRDRRKWSEIIAQGPFCHLRKFIGRSSTRRGRLPLVKKHMLLN